jgi:hypothetical protein
MALIFEARGSFLGVFHVGYAKVFFFSSFWGSVRELHIELVFLGHWSACFTTSAMEERGESRLKTVF